MHLKLYCSQTDLHVLARPNDEATVTAAIHRIGDLFSSEFDIYLWLFLLRGDKFKACMRGVQSSICATSSSAKAHPSTYKRTGQILEVHAYGLELVTAKNRAKLYWDGDHFRIDWENVDLLSEEYVKEWGSIMRHMMSNLRFVSSLECFRYVS